MKKSSFVFQEILSLFQRQKKLKIENSSCVTDQQIAHNISECFKHSVKTEVTKYAFGHIIFGQARD